MADRRCSAADPHPFFADAVSISRFWRLVNTASADECWLWRGDTNKDGYGVFYFKDRKYGAHELALSFTTGEKRHPELETCHACDTPLCCNPKHLRFDTHLSNVREMHERGRARNGSKLTSDKVRIIRERRAMGARQIDLAEQYGVNNGTISMIVRGIRWPNAGGPIEKSRAQYRKG